MAHPDYVQDLIREAYADVARDQMKQIRQLAIDTIGAASTCGDQQTVKAMDHILMILNVRESE